MGGNLEEKHMLSVCFFGGRSPLGEDEQIYDFSDSVPCQKGKSPFLCEIESPQTNHRVLGFH